MGPIKLTVHSTGSGQCSLTGKEGSGLTVSFDDGTVREGFLSWRAFQQLLGMKAGQPKHEPKTLAAPVANGPALVK